MFAARSSLRACACSRCIYRFGAGFSVRPCIEAWCVECAVRMKRSWLSFWLCEASAGQLNLIVANFRAVIFGCCAGGRLCSFAKPNFNKKNASYWLYSETDLQVTASVICRFVWISRVKFLKILMTKAEAISGMLVEYSIKSILAKTQVTLCKLAASKFLRAKQNYFCWRIEFYFQLLCSRPKGKYCFVHSYMLKS